MKFKYILSNPDYSHCISIDTGMFIYTIYSPVLEHLKLKNENLILKEWQLLFCCGGASQTYILWKLWYTSSLSFKHSWSLDLNSNKGQPEVLHMTSNLCSVIGKNGAWSMWVFIRGQSSVRLNFNLCSAHSAVCMCPTKTIWDIVKL